MDGPALPWPQPYPPYERAHIELMRGEYEVYAV